MDTAERTPFAHLVIRELRPTLLEAVQRSLASERAVATANALTDQFTFAVASRFKSRALKEARAAAEASNHEAQKTNAAFAESVTRLRAIRQEAFALSAEASAQDVEALRLACRSNWEHGTYAVTLASVPPEAGYFALLMTVAIVGSSFDEAEDALKRVEHVGPHELVRGIALDDAVGLKELFEAIGCDVKIREGALSQASRREAIPESVRHEVWRRDQGCCVDCGSCDRLEFDHIIPLSKGGSSTARNIELRCEPCNRRKAARI